METAILILWTIGLLAALGLTLVVLKLVALVLRTLAGIRSLAEDTAATAARMHRILDAPDRLEDAATAAAAVRRGSARLAESARSVNRAAAETFRATGGAA